MFTKSKPPQPRMYRTKHLKPKSKNEPTVDNRQRKISDFNQEALSTATLLVIGAGGLGGEIGETEVRKGVGTLVLFDHDLVELTNLNRQRFYENDLDKPKAHRLALNLAKEGFMGSTIIGYALSFQDALALGVDMSGSVIVSDFSVRHPKRPSKRASG